MRSSRSTPRTKSRRFPRTFLRRSGRRSVAKPKRQIGLEILEELRQLKRGEHRRVMHMPSVSSIRERTGLSQARPDHAPRLGSRAGELVGLGFVGCVQKAVAMTDTIKASPSAPRPMAPVATREELFFLLERAAEL